MTKNKLQIVTVLKKMSCLFVICFLLFVIFPNGSRAASSASLYFTSAKVNYTVGENIAVKLRVNPNSEQINVVRSRFHFNTNVADIVSSTLDGAWPYQSPGSSLNIPGGVANLGGFILSTVITSDSQFMTFVFVGRQVGDLTFTFDSNNLLIDPTMTNQIDNALLRPYTVHIGAGTPPPAPVDCNVTNSCPPPPLPPVDCHVTNTCPPPPPPIGPVNHAPIINDLGEKLGYIAQEVKFTVTATDPDNDSIILSTDDAPASAIFNPSTGVFSWTSSVQGIFYVTFRATDNSPLGPLSSTKTVRITVFCSQAGATTGGGGSTLTCPTGGEGAVLVCPICQQETAPATFKACTVPSGTQLRSQSHPDQDAWYSSNFVTLRWNQDAKALGYKIALTKAPELGAKDIISRITDTQMSYKDVPDGIWYFHLIAQYEGNCSPDNTFRVKVDTKSPELSLTDVTVTGEEDNFYFAGKDVTSGVAYFESRVDAAQWSKATSPVVLKKNSGKSLSLRAEDNAGNVTEVQFSLDDFKQVGDASEYTIFVPAAKTLTTPVINQMVIRKISGQPAPTDLLIFTGNSEPNSSVTLYLASEGKGSVSMNTETDSSGNWTLLYDKPLARGSYIAYVSSTKDGKQSPNSNEVRLVLGEDKYSIQVFPWSVLFIGMGTGGLIIILLRLFIYDILQFRKRK